LSKGHKLTVDDLQTLRPADGISPMEIDEVVGKTLSCDVTSGSSLKWENLA
jgi:N-acetylneuraminate synthase/N,N'-diacetyllegionaminate synthase